MIPTFHPRLVRRRREKVIRVGVKTPHGWRFISTGQTSYEKAREVCTEAMVGELQMAACAQALTPEVICRLTQGRRITALDILELWKTQITEDLAPDTVANYESIVRDWLRVMELGTSVLARVRRSDVLNYINGNHIKIGTRRARRAALVSYFKFASNHGYITGNIADSVVVHYRDLTFGDNELVRTLPITRKEYEALMASRKVKGFWRWATALGWHLGLRLRDVACLEWASIRPDRIVLYPRKTGRRLELLFDEVADDPDHLAKIIQEMIQKLHADPTYCFPRQRATALSPTRRAGLSVSYKRVLIRHGIKHKRFHGLRHAFAIRLRQRGLNNASIAPTLGHASALTTAIYTHETD